MTREQMAAILCDLRGDDPTDQVTWEQALREIETGQYAEWRGRMAYA